MPTAADAFVIVASVAIIFLAVRLPALGDALGRLLPRRHREAPTSPSPNRADATDDRDLPLRR